MSMVLFLLPGIVPSRSEMVSGRVSDGAGVGRIAWYTLAGDPWYTLADYCWYIIARLMTLNAGADLVTVQKLMGHAQANTTARCARRGEPAKRSAVQKLAVPYQRHMGSPPESCRDSRFWSGPVGSSPPLMRVDAD